MNPAAMTAIPRNQESGANGVVWRHLPPTVLHNRRIHALPHPRPAGRRHSHICSRCRDTELAAHGALWKIAQHGPCPCRISLTDATPGDEVILANYEHHEVDSPYRMRFAIYVRKGEKTYDKVDEIPEQLRKRSLAARAFDEDGMMVGWELVEGEKLEERDRAAARRAARRLPARPFRRARLLCGKVERA